MPRRAKVALLPEEIRRELDRRLIAGAFGGYVDLAEWLNDQGCEIGKSALHQYGSQLEKRIARIRYATETAEAIVAAAPDDNSAVADAGLRMVQEQIYSLLLAADTDDMKELAATARALAETARASLAVRQDRRKLLTEAAGRADQAASKAGLSADVAAAIRAAIEGGTP